MKVIDYSLYWLASQRVDEIIICCTKFEEEINDYLVNTNWNIENLFFIWQLYLLIELEAKHIQDESSLH